MTCTGMHATPIAGSSRLLSRSDVPDGGRILAQTSLADTGWFAVLAMHPRDPQVLGDRVTQVRSGLILYRYRCGGWRAGRRWW